MHATCSLVLSCSNTMSEICIKPHICLYASVLIAVVSIYTTKMPYQFQKMVHMVFLSEKFVLNFLGFGESVRHNCSICCLLCSVMWQTHISSPVTIHFKKLSHFSIKLLQKKAAAMHFVLWMSISLSGTHLKYNFL